MKKVLIVLGFAMLATAAMAQTKKPVNAPMSHSERFIQKVKADMAAEKPVDYKASIFTKDGETLVQTFDFTTDAGIIYGANGLIHAGDVINGQAVPAARAHGFSSTDTYWQRFTMADIPDSAKSGNNSQVYGGSAAFNNLYSEAPFYGATKTRLGAYLSDSLTTSATGFMFISLIDHHGQAGVFHAFFQMPAIAMPAGRLLVDVDWYQYNRKFYDTTYVDYKLADGWHSVECNIEGVDVDVNGTSPQRYVLTLPAAAAGPDNLELRFRIYGREGAAAHGYMWAVDDVKVIAVTSPSRWGLSSEGHLDGFYGTLPQGFNIPIAYTLNVRNKGTQTLTGNHMYLNHIAPNGTTTEVIDATQIDVPAGNVLQNYVFRINERGFMHPEYGFDANGYYDHARIQSYSLYNGDATTPAWRASSGQFGTTAEAMAAGFQMRGLPTENVGKNKFYISLANAEGLTATFDTITYTVSGYLNDDPDYGFLGGYRWSHDNGVIPGGSEYAWQWDTPYVGNDPEVGHQYDEGYQLYTRYNSPSEIPVDNQGRPWVIKGIEYVTSTSLTASQVTGQHIAPMLMKQVLDDTGAVDFVDIATGLSANDYSEVPATAAAESRFGYTLPGEPYNAFDLQLPAQPELEPNLTYLVGYVNGGGTFSLAQIQHSYAISHDGEDFVYRSYYNEPALRDYYNQFNPLNKPYDAWTYDPTGSNAAGTYHSIFGYNIDVYPMVRLIVGPRQHIDKYSILSECSNTEENQYWIYRSDLGENVCGFTDTNIYEGGSVSYYILPGADEDGVIDSMVIDNIYIDGTPIDLNDENMVSAVNYDVYHPDHGEGAEEEWPALLERSYYIVTLRNINSDHTISAAASTRHLGVLQAEDKVNLQLAPNPATSQVKLNLTGVQGMVQCSILDMSGRVVYSSNINANNETVINLNGIAAGAYFVRVTGNDFSKVEKLIVR